MFERLAITAVGVGATVVLTVGLVAAGFAPRSGEPAASIDAALLAAQASAGPSADATLEPQIVYVRSAPARRTVVVERQAVAAEGSSESGMSDTRSVRLARDDDDTDRWEREDHDGRGEREDDERERDDD